MKKIIAILLSVVIMLTSFAFAVSAEDATEASNVLKFNEDGSFRIMQITDTHYTDQYNYLRPLGISLLEVMLDKYEPDLVVFTGDNIKGYFDLATPRTVQMAIDQVVSPVADRNIPFAVVFGNHDYQSMVTEKHQMVMYNQYPTCIAEDGYCVLTRHGNYNATIKDSTGTKDIFNLWFVDSGTKTISDENASVNKSQIKWYQDTAEDLAAANNGLPLPSIWFQHIPIKQTTDFLMEVEEGTAGAIKGDYEHDGKYVALNPEKATGSLKEYPSFGVDENGLYDAWLETGDVIGAFFGHDHKNDYQGYTDDGILLAATKTAGFWSRHEGSESGIRIIDLNENDTSKIETQSVHYSEVGVNVDYDDKAEYDMDIRIEDFFYHIVLEIRMIVSSFKYYVSFLF